MDPATAHEQFIIGLGFRPKPKYLCVCIYIYIHCESRPTVNEWGQYIRSPGPLKSQGDWENIYGIAGGLLFAMHLGP